MTTDSNVVRAEPHVEIGNLIERDADTLVELWCLRAAEEQPAARRAHHDVLRDHFPKFLRAMAKALRESSEASRLPHERAAEQHGEQRWENGWSLAEVVRDYQILRLVVIEYLEQVLSRSVMVRETMAIGVFIDDAIAVSISAYVANREEAILAAERERQVVLEDVSRRKDEFMATLGHELRNPLAPILTAVKIIQTVGAAGSQALTSATEVIERQSKHMVRLVDDLLDLARIGRGSLELRKERIDLATAIHQAVEACDPMMCAREQKLTVAMPNMPLPVDADPSRMVQIFSNLLNNASKYTQVRGEIRVSGELEDHHVSVRVRDNGMGIPADMLDRVFDLFTQVEGTQQYSGGGMGIGLALVQRLVQEHGGVIRCESAGTGLGSAFIVSLPLATGTAVPRRAADQTMLRVEPIAKPKAEN